MNKYESIMIVAPTIDEKKQKEIENKYIQLINESGEIEVVKNLGKRKLAYEINKNKEGIYFEFDFKSKSDFISELERRFRIDDDVFKFIVVKRED